MARAKRKDNREWVEGFYFCMRHNDERTHVHHFMIPIGADLSKGLAIDRIQIEIDPDTVCRYIGVNDTNGKSIFTGHVPEGCVPYHKNGYMPKALAVEFDF